MLKEFREFAMRGNVVDLAVGVVIGAAFGKIVDSLVKDIIMPPLGFLIGKVDFTNMFVTLGEVPAGTAMTYDALKKAGVPMLAYGNFITILINFIILAFVIFMLVKAMNRLRRQSEAQVPAVPEPSEEVQLLREISRKLDK